MKPKQVRPVIKDDDLDSSTQVTIIKTFGNIYDLKGKAQDPIAEVVDSGPGIKTYKNKRNILVLDTLANALPPLHWACQQR